MTPQKLAMREQNIDRIARWAIGLQLFSTACWIAVLVLEFWT